MTMTTLDIIIYTDNSALDIESCLLFPLKLGDIGCHEDLTKRKPRIHVVRVGTHHVFPWSDRDTRTATAPELWIPYVMIGVSCVTFLAVHFYCYHKRNRERYLRKRDEKRVKSGLLERRRITTLMVARYQSNLGISRKAATVEVNQQIYYDRRDQTELDKKGNNNEFYLRDMCDPESAPLSFLASATQRLTRSSSTNEIDAPKLTSSQSWPLVSESRTLASNAHCKTVRENDDPCPTDYSVRRSKPTLNITKPVSVKSISDYDELLENRTGGRPYKYGYTGHNSYVPHRHHCATSMLKPPMSTYPNVFYTNLPHSQFTSPSPLFFKLKQGKRHYDGDPVDEMSELCKPHDHHHHHHHPIHDRGEVSSPFYDDGDISEPYILADPNDDGFGYGSRGHNHYHTTVLDASGFAVSEDEAYPFTDFREEYCGVKTNDALSSARRYSNSKPPQVIGYNHCARHSKKKAAYQALFKKEDAFHEKRNKPFYSPHNINYFESSGARSLVSTTFSAESKQNSGLVNTVGGLVYHYDSNNPQSHSKTVNYILNGPNKVNKPPPSSGQLIKGIVHAPATPDIKPYPSATLLHADGSTAARNKDSLLGSPVRNPAPVRNHYSPCSTWAAPSSPKLTPRCDASPCSPLLSPTSLGQYSTFSSMNDTLPGSPHQTPGSCTSPSSPMHTPSTPGSGASRCSLHQTPPLRTLNPNLVFQHAKKKAPVKPD
ncbi:hypothetical protein Btru_046324 [Bulinus truncatus]|nr:hypothetical protein Btru_046324 [Bulinus truncatus]